MNGRGTAQAVGFAKVIPYTAIASDNHHDQIAFFPGSTQARFTGQMNVFDFDNALFRDLYEDRGLKPLLAYARYHMSDHRPLWVAFKTN